MTNEEAVVVEHKYAKLIDCELSRRIVHAVFDGSNKMLSFGWWDTVDEAWKSARETSCRK